MRIKIAKLPLQYYLSKKCEKFQFLQFLSYINNIYIKRMHFLCRIQFRTKKKYDLFSKKRKKKSFVFTFWSKFRLIFCFQQQIYEISAMKPQRLLYQNFLKYLKLKVTIGELWIFNQLEMTSYQEQSVLPRHRLWPKHG